MAAELQNATVRLRWRRPLLKAVAVGAIAIALLALPHLGIQALVLQATGILIFVLLATSLNLIVGYAGMVSMGHAAFFALGGYTAALCTKLLGFGMGLSLLAGPALAALAALIISLLSTRLTHAYFIMVTLAFAQIIHTGIWKWYAVTGGDDGLIGFSPAPALSGTIPYYYFTLAIVATCIVILYRLCRSPFGFTLTAIRDNPTRTAFVGVNVRLCRLAAFVIAGLFAGIAGALQAFFQRGMFPDSASFVTSADVLVVVMLGGPRYFAGPIVGAVLFKILNIVIPQYTVYWPFFLGLVIIAIALFLPNGLLSSRGDGRSGEDAR